MSSNRPFAMEKPPVATDAPSTATRALSGGEPAGAPAERRPRAGLRSHGRPLLTGAARRLVWVTGLVAATAALARAAQARELSGPFLLSLVVWGVMLGGIIALGAIGLSLVYGVQRFANFAHGDLMTAGAYVALAVLPVLPPTPPVEPFSFGWEFVAVLVVGAAATGLVAVGLDRLLYRPLRRRRASPVILAMASLGAAFFVRSLVYLGWGADFRFYYVGRARPSLSLPLGVRVRPDQLFIFALALLLVGLVYVLLEKTKMGKAMRATADNPALARVSGIDTERVAFWTWMLGGMLAGAAGVMLGFDAQLRPEMGWYLLLSLFAAAILGSVGNPYGALAGGLVIGLVQQVATAFVNPAYGPGVAFLVMIGLLLVRPQGLFGRAGG